MDILKQLFADWAGQPCADCLAIGASSASARRYFRLTVADGRSAIGTIADDIRENEAFFAYCRHLRGKGINVPELYSIAPDRRHYLQQDLGDLSLYGLLREKKQNGGGFDRQMLLLYRQVLADLAEIQQAGRDIDFSVAYPRPAFDRRSILWDLNYFKYYFLKLSDIPFDEELLENDFQTLADLLLQADCSFFLYRDFNPRNIMVCEERRTKNDELSGSGETASAHSSLFYIDFQGGRRGAAQYDVASLLYSAKSDLPQPLRDELLRHYLDIRNITGDERTVWLRHFRLYLLVRILQTLGAYGFRGLYQRKPYFIESIPLALNNLRHLLENHPDTLAALPHLASVLDTTLNTPTTPALTNSPIDTLTVTVLSFSYKQGLPQDTSGNGGGHIFDCRALPNPGRYPEYKTYTGADRPVIEFLGRESAVDRFLSNVHDIVGQSVDKYLERNFTHLSVAFGCTGGQHRSVYCAEQTARWLRDTYPQIVVQLVHREQNISTTSGPTPR